MKQSPPVIPDKEIKGFLDHTAYLHTYQLYFFSLFGFDILLTYFDILKQAKQEKKGEKKNRLVPVFTAFERNSEKNRKNKIMR